MSVEVRAARPFLRWAVALAILSAAALAGSGSATAADEPAGADGATDPTIGIAGGPANESGPDNRSRFSYAVEPGQTVTDRYVVRNTGTTDQQVTVLGSDAYNTNDGAFALLETDETPVDAGSWVTFDGQPSVEVSLAPTEQKVLEFTVAVPADATPGDHAAGVVVSAQSTEGQVRVDRRVATRMYVRVAGELQPALTVSSISARQSLDWNPLSGTTDITVTVQNTGNVALGADVDAHVTTWFGRSAGGSSSEELLEMLPGSTREVTFSVPGVPRVGYLQPEVTLHPTVAEDALDPGPLRDVTRDTTVVAVPWLLLGVIAAVVAFVLLARWRRKRLAREAEAWIAHTQEEARREAAEQVSGGSAEAAAVSEAGGRAPSGTGTPPTTASVTS